MPLFSTAKETCDNVAFWRDRNEYNSVFYRVWKQTVTLFIGIYLKIQPRDIKLKKNSKILKDKVENYLVTTTYLFNTGIPNVYVNVINIFINRMIKNSLLTFLSVFSHWVADCQLRERCKDVTCLHPPCPGLHIHQPHDHTQLMALLPVNFIGLSFSVVCFKGMD